MIKNGGEFTVTLEELVKIYCSGIRAAYGGNPTYIEIKLQLFHLLNEGKRYNDENFIKFDEVENWFSSFGPISLQQIYESSETV